MDTESAITRERPVASERLQSIDRLTRDLRAAAQTMSAEEARYLVDYYYITQGDRIRANNQLRALRETGEPGTLLLWLGEQAQMLENTVKTGLDIYSANHPVGAWARDQKGVGPVIAAGLLGHIDITKAPTVGHIWRFAGLDPTVEWERGQKRPWNASLKVLCWKLGESFVKVSGHEDAFYGGIYRKRKELEVERNERGDFADQAEAALKAKKIGKTTEAYKAYIAGRLPAARIHLRAQRYAVKLFLAHLHDVWYRHEYDEPPPKPYAIAVLGHGHMIPPPTSPEERTEITE